VIRLSSRLLVAVILCFCELRKQLARERWTVIFGTASCFTALVQRVSNCDEIQNAVLL